jgi:hypothetical protein
MYKSRGIFKVFVGNSIQPPIILRRQEDIRMYDSDLVVDVPEEYQRYFELDVRAALRDFAGISIK